MISGGGSLVPFPPGSQTPPLPDSGLLEGPCGPEFGAVGRAWTDLVPIVTSPTVVLGKLLRSGPQFAHLKMGISEDGTQ